jgi:hypothetical protein
MSILVDKYSYVANLAIQSRNSGGILAVSVLQTVLHSQSRLRSLARGAYSLAFVV